MSHGRILQMFMGLKIILGYLLSTGRQNMLFGIGLITTPSMVSEEMASRLIRPLMAIWMIY
jgi:hypothetical protein